MLKATGVNQKGRREVLGISVSLSEAEVHWRTFLQSLVARGLCGVELIISDDHPGLRQARRAVLSSGVCPGNAVSAICSGTPGPMCPGRA